MCVSNTDPLCKISACNYSNDFAACVVGNVYKILTQSSIDIDSPMDRFIEIIRESGIKFRMHLFVSLQLEMWQNSS